MASGTMANGLMELREARMVTRERLTDSLGFTQRALDVRLTVDVAGIRREMRKTVLWIGQGIDSDRVNEERGKLLGYTGPLTPRQRAHWHRTAGR